MSVKLFKGIDAEFSEVILATLPAMGLEFVRIIGLEPALALISTFGGAEIRFPRDPNHWRFERISNAIGREAAIKLSKEFQGSEQVYIPRCDRTRSKLRARQIVIEFDELTRKQGMSGRDAYNELAIKHGMSNRSIEILVNKPD